MFNKILRLHYLLNTEVDWSFLCQSAHTSANFPYVNLPIFPQFIGFLLIKHNLSLYQPAYTDYISDIIPFIWNVQKLKVLYTFYKANWSNRWLRLTKTIYKSILSQLVLVKWEKKSLTLQLKTIANQ